MTSPKDLSKKFGLENKGLTRRLRRLVQKGKLDRFLDIQHDARAVVYRRRNAPVSTTMATDKVTS
jgi:DNA-binding MarR family transcriptional regulator